MDKKKYSKLRLSAHAWLGIRLSYTYVSAARDSSSLSEEELARMENEQKLKELQQ
jgi:hypothetical protein